MWDTVASFKCLAMAIAPSAPIWLLLRAIVWDTVASFNIFIACNKSMLTSYVTVEYIS